jgi:hypothetical protein
VDTVTGPMNLDPTKSYGFTVNNIFELEVLL